MYSKVHRTLAPGIGAGAGEGDMKIKKGRINLAAYRWLCHATFNPALDRFRLKVNTSVKHVRTWYEREDYGASFYYKVTKLESWVPPYRDRVSWAVYISATSAKLQWLAGCILETCLLGGKKLLIFCNWPMTSWDVELFLNILDIGVYSIRSSHSIAQRQSIIEAWNDPNDEVKVLVTTYKIGGTSMNLHEHCSALVMMEPAESANMALQCVGRVFRIGQTEA